MKAKEWIKQLSAVLANEPPHHFTEEAKEEWVNRWFEEVRGLMKECGDIFRMRMGGLTEKGYGGQRFVEDRVIAAYREAEVKLHSVVHGLEQAGHKATFPLMRHGLLFNHLHTFAEQLKSDKRDLRSEEPVLRVYEKAVETFGLKGKPAFDMALELAQKLVRKSIHEDQSGYLGSMREYQLLRLRAELIGLTSAEKTKMQSLERWLMANIGKIR